MSYYFPQASVTLKVLFEDFQARSQAELQKTYTLEVECKRLNVNGNDYKTSDTFDCEIDYKNFPFDPRTIRACGVTIHIEDMQSVYNSDGSLNKIVPSKQNAVFVGFVDKENINFDDSKRLVKFEGRDLTALLIDEKYAQNTPISLAAPVDVAIGSFLAQFPATKEIKVVNKTGKELPSLAYYYPGFNNGSGLTGSKSPGQHESYWEIIQDIVNRAGLIAYMHLDQLWISNPRTVFNSNNAVKFIYGKNIKSLEFSRKLGRHKGFNVMVRSLAGKDVITAKVPEEAEADWLKAMGLTATAIRVPKLKPDGTLDTTQDQLGPYMSFKIPHIGTHAQLVKIGQKTFEELIRQDLEGSLETNEMLAHSGNSEQDPNYKVYDLTTGTTGGLPLDVGQPVSIQIEMDDLNKITQLATVAERTRYLIQHGYDKTVASIFAKTLGKTASVFYTKSYQLSLDADSGFKFKLNFINFIDLSNKGIAV